MLAGNLYIRIPFDGKLKIWKLKEVDLSEEIDTSGEILRIELGHFYYSIKHCEFGWGECPYQKFEVIVIVKDSGGAVSAAKVNNEKITDDSGEVVYLESAGLKMFYAVKDGITGAKLIEINQQGQRVTIKLGKNETEPVDDNAVVQVFAGMYGSNCAAVTEDGRLYLWGDNQYGQIGNGKTAAQKTPWESPLDRLDNQKVKSVYLGNYCSMAVTEDGSLYAWGTNRYGETGQETENEYYTIPQKVKGIENIKEVAIHAGANVNYKYNVIAVLQKDGGLYMWGSNSFGEIGNGSGGNGAGSSKVTIPTKILDNVEKICLGGDMQIAFQQQLR